jgi:hypothetical protein
VAHQAGCLMHHRAIGPFICSWVLCRERERVPQSAQAGGYPDGPAGDRRERGCGRPAVEKSVSYGFSTRTLLLPFPSPVNLMRRGEVNREIYRERTRRAQVGGRGRTAASLRAESRDWGFPGTPNRRALTEASASWPRLLMPGPRRPPWLRAAAAPSSSIRIRSSVNLLPRSERSRECNPPL